ncbi:MAG: sn-glycerol-3-phosphate ABC transporter ATP-binding protein UgpC [Salinisphaera sp.]|jgi:multiple sugar transport system ATP-binding protein|nr:sn-glycerol-3-phosphate ABC transporter ATP-binding protein UgpC [Salinisphaera sp.]
MAVVKLENVCRYFGSTPAVLDFNLETREGEFVVLVGPSGCGKSTTLRMIAGLEEMDSGTLSFDGRPMQDVPVQDREIAMVFQSYALYPHRNVYDNLAFALKLRRFPKAEIEKRVRHAAQTLDIEPLLLRKPRELSGGQRQRVALGRAIVREPDVFLMDEPLSNLDAKLRVTMRAEIAKLHRRIGVTTFYVTHDQVEAMTMGDRIVVMNGGVIQQIATPLALYDEPVNSYVAGFIGNPPMNFLDADVSEDGGRIRGPGFDFELEPSLQQRLSSRNQHEVTIGFRPEHLKPRTDDALPTMGILQGTIELVEQMGSTTDIRLTVDGHSLIAELPRDQTLQIKDAVELGLLAGRLHVFDRDSGDRLNVAVSEIQPSSVRSRQSNGKLASV